MASRDITAAVAAELAKRRVAPVYLFDLEFDSGTTRLWSGWGDLEWNGNTYQGGGELLDWQVPGETTDVRAEGAQVSLSGIPSAWISTALQEPYQGRPARQYLGFMRVDYDTDQSVNTAADSTSNDNDGTLQNDPQWTSDEVTDRIVGALSFDGVDDLVDVGNDSALNFGTGALLMEVWAKFGTDADAQRIISKRGGSAGYELVPRNNVVSVALGDGDNLLHHDVGSTDIEDDDFHMLSAYIAAPDTNGDRAVTAYVDSNEDGTTSFAGIGNIDTASGLIFGSANPNGVSPLPGTLAEIRLWDVTGLSKSEVEQQIADNMNKRLNGDESGLVGYWRLDDGVLVPGELINDPITVFRGRMDQMQVEEEGDTSTIALSLESNLIDLNKPRERRYTDQDQKSDYPNDRGFEYVAALQGKALTWGPDTRSKNERVRDTARIRADVTTETRRFTRDGRRIQQQVAVDDEGNVVAEGQEVSLGFVGGSPGGGQAGSPSHGGHGAPGIGGSPGGHGRG